MPRSARSLELEKLHDECLKACAEKWITFGYSDIADVIHTALGPMVIMPDYFEEDLWKLKKQNSRSS